jgi:hypothetical protein
MVFRGRCEPKAESGLLPVQTTTVAALGRVSRSVLPRLYVRWLLVRREEPGRQANSSVRGMSPPRLDTIRAP